MSLDHVAKIRIPDWCIKKQGLTFERHKTSTLQSAETLY